MLYTPMTKKALRLCCRAHREQVDKSGLPYALHPLHLAEQMQTEDTIITALLHDVVEDTAWTLEELKAEGFSQAVLEALALLTHDPSLPYLDYVARIKENPIARQFKLADLRHNRDLSRLDFVTARDLARAEKYDAAIALLTK